MGNQQKGFLGFGGKPTKQEAASAAGSEGGANKLFAEFETFSQLAYYL